MSLKLTAKALSPFCRYEMVAFHNDLKTKIGSHVCSAGCTSEDIKKQRQNKKKKAFTCTSGICDMWLADIEAQRATAQFSLDNTTVSLWPVHPW